jgi:Flp pilus assembly pilin Flp
MPNSSHTPTACRREDGQTTSEYAVVLGMITVIVVGAWAALTGAIPTAISAVTSAI